MTTRTLREHLTALGLKQTNTPCWWTGYVALTAEAWMVAANVGLGGSCARPGEIDVTFDDESWLDRLVNERGEFV